MFTIFRDGLTFSTFRMYLLKIINHEMIVYINSNFSISVHIDICCLEIVTFTMATTINEPNSIFMSYVYVHICTINVAILYLA